MRRTEAVLGTGEKSVHAVEQELRHFARRSIFTTRAIRRGEAFSRDNVDVLRHGELDAGLAPERMSEVLGSTASRDLAPDTALQSADLARGSTT